MCEYICLDFFEWKLLALCIEVDIATAECVSIFTGGRGGEAGGGPARFGRGCPPRKKKQKKRRKRWRKVALTRRGQCLLRAGLQAEPHGEKIVERTVYSSPLMWSIVPRIICRGSWWFDGCSYHHFLWCAAECFIATDNQCWQLRPAKV